MFSRVGRPPLRAACLVVGVLASLGWATVARAGDLDGEWKRDDGKVYLVCGDRGLQVDGSEYRARFVWTDVLGKDLELDLTFTRASDEAVLFKAQAKGIDYDGKTHPQTIRLSWGWVDVDADGNVQGRGEEEHTLTRTRALTADETRRLPSVLAYHAACDACLKAGTFEYDPKKALKCLIEGTQDKDCAGDTTLAARLQVLEKKVTLSPEERAQLAKEKARGDWFEQKKAEVASFDAKRDADGLRKVGLEVVHGEPGGSGADERCFGLASEALAKANALRPADAGLAFECAAALYWARGYDRAGEVLRALRERTPGAKDRAGVAVEEWLERLASAVSHGERYQELTAEANGLEDRTISDSDAQARYERLRDEASRELEARDKAAELFVNFFFKNS